MSSVNGRAAGLQRQLGEAHDRLRTAQADFARSAEGSDFRRHMTNKITKTQRSIQRLEASLTSLGVSTMVDTHAWTQAPNSKSAKRKKPKVQVVRLKGQLPQRQRRSGPLRLKALHPLTMGKDTVTTSA